ncbi:MAG: hypothetical protein IH830_04330 [Planctomycetes bacterium]|nr:hypothetical protein [Planctomycetota bacterium]
MAKLSTALVLVMALAVPVMGQTAKQPQEPQENKDIPPDILRQMDPGLRYNTRPKIEVIKQGDIFGLREKPRRDADVVMFNFEADKLSTAHRNILDAWIRARHNKVVLKDQDIQKYAAIFGLRAKKQGFPAPRDFLVAHPVNTDCRNLYFRGYAKSNKDSSVWAVYHFYQLDPAASTVIATVDVDKARVVCGAFAYGERTIYFYNEGFGPDWRRWQLNFWHWVLDLRVPGAAETGAMPGVGSAAAGGARRPLYDAIKLKNGDTMSGVILNESFTIKASYGVLTFPRAQIDRITIEGGGFNVDELILKVGDRISGVLQDAKIRVKLSSGAEADLDKDKVKEIQIRYEEVDAEATEGSQKDGR